MDFLTKPVRGDELLDAVQRALARGAAAREMQRQKREWGARYESLTPREREVFALVVGGLLNKQIADVLGICERTVKAHRGQVMHKMGVQSPAELGRAVEWLGEIFESASARPTGKRMKMCMAIAMLRNLPKSTISIDRQICDNGGVYPDTSASKCIIAIVEDDASLRRALQRLLGASGFEAHTFASAEEFLGSAVPESYACLILDIRLPGMSGFELFDHLTASAQPRPAIFITAQDEDSVRQQASRIPNSVYLRKPVVGAVLLEAIRSLLSRSSSGAESPGT